MEENTVIIETPQTPVRDFVRRYKTTIAVTATAATCLVLNQIAVKQHDKFLKEHDLYDEFYSDPSDQNL